MNQWKSAHAVDTDKRTLAEALVGADVFIGLSVKGALTQEMVAAMAPKPIIFAMANPDPEITPEEVHEVRPDAIIATGRSDYPNQVNNVLGFPYIFRGALDVRARRVNMEMKIACANALAQLAREDVPDEVAAAYHGRAAEVRARVHHPDALRSAADLVHPAVRRPGGDGHRRGAQADRGHGRLPRRAWPSGSIPPPPSCRRSAGRGAAAPKKRIVFAEGEEPSVIRAAYAFQNAGPRQGRPGRPRGAGAPEHARWSASIPAEAKLEIVNARLSRPATPTTSTTSTSGCSARATCAATCSG